MHKIHHSYTASAFGILEKVSPKGASEYNCVGPEWGGDELRSSRSAVVPSTTPFACHHNPVLGTVLNILSQEGVMRRQDMENPALPLEMFPLRECSDLWVQFSSAAQLCLTLCDPMDCSMPIHTIILSITNSRSLLKLMSIEWWYHPTISSSVVPFSSLLQSSPASGSFPVSQFFTSGGQNIGVSALVSVLARIFRTDFI